MLSNPSEPKERVMGKRAILMLALVAALTGCLGTGGLSGKVKKFNLSATENRWGREALFVGMQALWVYRISTVLDLFIFNSIEFWSGTNPLNGRSPMVDVPPSEVEKMGLREIDRARVELVSENAAKLHLDFQNGDRMAFDVLRDGQDYEVSYLGRVFFEGTVDGELSAGGNER
jgi:hypothetical protein